MSNTNSTRALEEIRKLESRVESLENKLEASKSENATLTSSIKLLQEKCIRLVAKTRRENLVLDEITENHT